MGALGHYLEQEGVATAGISLVRLHSEIIQPPRAVWVPFEFGRPLGAPGDAAFQRRVLMAVLGLLEAPAGPLLVDFDVEPPVAAASPAAEEDMEEGWVCPISLPRPPDDLADPSGFRAALLEETNRLLPWHDLARERRGRSTFGASGLDMSQIVAFLTAFFGEAEPDSPIEGVSRGDALKVAMEDLKAFYTEAAGAQPGRRAATSGEVADWLWGETTAGRMLLALKPVCLASRDKVVQAVAMHAMVPRAQLGRATTEEGRRNFEVPPGGHLQDD